MADTPKRRLFPHGGARRRRGQPSETLSEAQCLRVLQASEKAAVVGRPLNRFITILWQRGGIEECAATTATQKFLKLAGDWMRKRGEAFCWVYVHEWGPVNGAHVHLLMHVPSHLSSEFSRMRLRWVRHLLPSGYVTKTVDSKKLPGADAPDNVSAEVYRHSLLARLHYVLKAASPELEWKLGLTGHGRVRWGRYCRVFGQRYGCWQGRARPV